MIKARARTGNVTLTLTMNRESAATLSGVLQRERDTTYVESVRREMVEIIDTLTNALYN